MLQTRSLSSTSGSRVGPPRRAPSRADHSQHAYFAPAQLSVQGVVASLGGLGKLNHVAIAVPSLEDAIVLYRDVLGANVGEPQVPDPASAHFRGRGAGVTRRIPPAQSLPDHGVTAQFVKLPNTKIELLQPLGEGSPIAGFLEKNTSGGIHHICVEVRRGGATVSLPPRLLTGGGGRMPMR